MAEKSQHSNVIRGDDSVVVPIYRDGFRGRTLDPDVLHPHHHGHGPDHDRFSLRDYWHVLVRRKWSMALFLALILTVTAVGTYWVTPVYRATLTLQIEREYAKVVQFQDVIPVESTLDKDFYQTQYELLRSRTLAKRVMDQLDLFNHPSFAVAAPGRWHQWWEGMLNEPASAQGGERSSEQAQIDVFLKGLVVEPVRHSRLVKIHYDHPDPHIAAQIANYLAENFISMNLERRMDASSYAKTFLNERLLETKKRLEESEKRLAEFARRHELIKLDEKRTLQLQTLDSLTVALAAAQQERIDAEAVYREMQNTKGEGFTLFLQNEVIQKLKETEVSLETQYQENLRVYKPGYPLMRQLESQLAEVRATIQAEIAKLRDAIRADYQKAKRKERLLAKRVEQQKAQVLALQDSSIEYNILQRNVDTNRQLYDGLLQRLREVGVAGGVATNNVSIVDPAEVPNRKHSPKTLVNMLVALIIGLTGAVGLAFVIEHLDDTLKTTEDMERRIRLPVLGAVPRIRSFQDQAPVEQQIGLLAFYEPRSSLAEAYRSIRTSLLFSTRSGAPKVVVFTSPGPGEGKTTSALNVAITFTQTGSKVLLIDTDLRNPSIHRAFGLDNMTGLTNYLAGDAQPIEISTHTEVDNLFVIPSGPLPPNPAELLSGEKMAKLLDVAAEKFDYVIMDGPPILGLADALVLANMADGTVVVAEAGVTRQGHLAGAIKRLYSAHANVVGGILTKQKDECGSYGYHYDYYYYYGNDRLVREHDETPKLSS